MQIHTREDYARLQMMPAEERLIHRLTVGYGLAISEQRHRELAAEIRAMIETAKKSETTTAALCAERVEE